MIKPMHELNQAERLARREHRRQVFSPGEIASLEAEDERELKVATEQALAECRTRYDAMTDRERAEAAQNHDINDDNCRKHGEPLYLAWCKSCAAEAIRQAQDEVSAKWKHLRDLDGEEYCRLRDVLDETRKERDSMAEQFSSLVERLYDDIAVLRQRAEAAESALRAIQEIADEDLRRGDHPSGVAENGAANDEGRISTGC
jgi:hypothetical protein